MAARARSSWSRVTIPLPPHGRRPPAAHRSRRQNQPENWGGISEDVRPEFARSSSAESHNPTWLGASERLDNLSGQPVSSVTAPAIASPARIAQTLPCQRMSQRGAVATLRNPPVVAGGHGHGRWKEPHRRIRTWAACSSAPNHHPIRVQGFDHAMEDQTHPYRGHEEPD